MHVRIAPVSLYVLIMGSLSWAQEPTDSSFNAPSPFLQCSYIKPGCWETSQIVPQENGVAVLFTCRPTDPSPNINCSYIQGDGNGLAWFYTENNYTGFQYQAFGTYGQCYDLPKAYNKTTNSIQLNTNPSTICCIYTNSQCNTVGHDWYTVTSDIPEFLGFFKNGVVSYRCTEKGSGSAAAPCGYNSPSSKSQK